MNISKLLLLDPKSKQKSVSLTLVIISFILVVSAAGFQVAGKVDNVSVFFEMFLTTSGLYFGRRFNLNNKIIGVEGDKASKE